MNAPAAAAPIHRRSRFRLPQNSQINAMIANEAKARAAFRTSCSSLPVRARTGAVPIQLSTGVRKQNSARAAKLKGARPHPLPPAWSPTDAPVTKGTIRMPQAPCSRGKISDCRRPAELIRFSLTAPILPQAFIGTGNLGHTASNPIGLDWKQEGMPNRRHVALGTISFALCFSAWGLIGAFAPRFREAFQLT